MRSASALVLPLSCALVFGGMTTACTDRPYSSPQEQAANACTALGPKALSGAAIGGAGGALIGGAAGGWKGALIGGGIGALGGLLIGKQADAQDCAQAQAALQQIGSVGVGQVVAWQNSATGSHGSYVPTGGTFTQDGRVCRPIRADYYMKDHQPVTGDTGIVCRTPEGDWVRQAPPG